MRRLLLISLATVLLGASACGGDGATPNSSGRSPSASSSQSSSPSPTSGRAAREAVCRDVRAGIDAYNSGAFEETVAHFRTAVPLARRAVGLDPSRDSRLLARAVRYYADLPAQDYPDASASSPDFRHWKAVTLGLCVAGDDQLSPVPSPSESGLQA